jgi:hypothetical protein
MAKLSNIFDRLPESARVPLCVLFLTFSFAVWLFAISTATQIIYYILFFLPNYICGEYLAGKILPKAESLSVSRAGFSPLRIFVGLCVVVGFFTLVYGAWMLVHLTLLR